MKSYSSTSPEKKLLAIFSQYRKESGKTQTEIGEKTGFKKSNISRLENGIHSPNLRTLRKYADSLGLEFTIVFKEKQPDISPEQ